MRLDWKILWWWCQCRESQVASIEEATWTVTNEILWKDRWIYLKIANLDKPNKEIWRISQWGEGHWFFYNIASLLWSHSGEHRRDERFGCHEDWRSVKYSWNPRDKGSWKRNWKTGGASTSCKIQYIRSNQRKVEEEQRKKKSKNGDKRIMWSNDEDITMTPDGWHLIETPFH